MDPDGNPTNGITRTQTSNDYFITFSGNMMSTAAGGHDPWATDQYLNIWVCRLVNNQGQGQTGFAVFPWDATPNYDGVVINYGQFGKDNGDPWYSDGRIGTHEVGHFFGLSHNFKGACGGASPINCSVSGDSICDTPPQITWIQACQAGMVSCNNDLAMWENFMDYAVAGCRVMFTEDQALKARMNIDKWWFRKSLVNPSGCGITGVDNDLKIGSIKVYPNPSSEVVYVEFNDYETDIKVTVYDQMGRVIIAEQIANIGNLFRINNLAKGVYFLKIEINENIKVEKVIIQ